MEFLVIAAWLAVAFGAAAVAKSKNRSAIGYFILGFVLPLIGLLVAVAMRPLSAPADRASQLKPLRWTLRCAVIVFGVVVSVRFLNTLSGPSIEQEMQAMRKLPLMGLVISENPLLEQEVRDAAVEESRYRLKGRSSPLFQLGAKIRQQYIIPTLAKADDFHVMQAAEDSLRMAVHLQKTNASLCKEYGFFGIHDIRELDRKGRDLFNAALASQERAYLNGKSGWERPRLSDDEVVQILFAAGYSSEDFDVLVEAENLPPVESCAASVKFLKVPFIVSPHQGAPLARYQLTASQ